jgi:two-component system chemotaxis response regulator CheY
MAILVVDDSRAMRMIVLRELRKAGYETRDVAEAENGRDALEKIRAGGVDLVLSDWNMPEMNGMTLLMALRRDGNDIPFGFVTSESTPLMHRDALDAGADFVVTKPFTADTLALQVERALQGVRQGDGLAAALAPKELSLAGHFWSPSSKWPPPWEPPCLVSRVPWWRKRPRRPSSQTSSKRTCTRFSTFFPKPSPAMNRAGGWRA